MNWLRKYIWSGTPVSVAVWFGFAVWNIYGDSRPGMVVLNMVLMGIDAYEWGRNRGLSEGEEE